jgi:hypothetical protein
LIYACREEQQGAQETTRNQPNKHIDDQWAPITNPPQTHHKPMLLRPPPFSLPFNVTTNSFVDTTVGWQQ